MKKTNFLLTDAYKVIEEMGKNWEFGKHEAIKEFAERAKKTISISDTQKVYFDNLVKELTEKDTSVSLIDGHIEAEKGNQGK